jgi:HAD superfamily hydrolase (TIGR01549 family)
MSYRPKRQSDLAFLKDCKHIFLWPVIQIYMSKISAIIFDLGGVILDLDQGKTIRAFSRAGLDLDQMNMNSSIFNDFETGRISAVDFRQGIKTAMKGSMGDAEIDEAWNAMLLDTTHERFEMIAELKKKFKVYLLSNTNSIHIDAFRKYIETFSGLKAWDALFDKQFLSYEIGLRKPDKKMYEYIVKDIGQDAHKCLFIDDSIINIRGAAASGLRILHAQNPLDAKLLSEIQVMVS